MAVAVAFARHMRTSQMMERGKEQRERPIRGHVDAVLASEAEAQLDLLGQT